MPGFSLEDLVIGQAYFKQGTGHWRLWQPSHATRHSADDPHLHIMNVRLLKHRLHVLIRNVSRAEYDNIFGTLSKHGTHQGGSTLFQDNDIALNVDLLEIMLRERERLRGISTGEYEYTQGSTIQVIFTTKSLDGPDGRHRLLHRSPDTENLSISVYHEGEESFSDTNLHRTYQDMGWRTFERHSCPQICEKGHVSCSTQKWTRGQLSTVDDWIPCPGSQAEISGTVCSTCDSSELTRRRVEAPTKVPMVNAIWWEDNRTYCF